MEVACRGAMSSPHVCVSGEEVALYCSKYLPDIIKEQKAYKEGKLQKVRSAPYPRGTAPPGVGR